MRERRRRSPHRRSRSRGVVLLVLAVLGVLGAVVPATAPAVAAPSADTTTPAQVTIDELSPLIPGPKDTLHVRGVVTNTGPTALLAVSVQLRRSSAPVATRRDMADVSSTAIGGSEPADVPLPGTRVAVSDELVPGDHQAFDISVPLASLGFTSAGSYVLAVDVVARESGATSGEHRTGVVRTFLPWVPPGTDVAPIGLVWLWPLADWPARTADGTLLTNQTPTELSADGRLDQLLAVGERFRTTVSWVADPALLQTADAMSHGYQVAQGTTITAGDRQQQARQWLTRLGAIARTEPVRTLPYADVDASALTRANLANDVVRSITQGPRIATTALGAHVAGNFYWAPFGRLDRDTLNVLASAGVTTVVLSADALPATDPAVPTEGIATAALPTSVGSIRAVLTDPSLSRTLALPQATAGDVVLARQRFLAETATAALTLPPSQGSRAFVVGPDSVRWAASAALLSPLLRATRSAAWLAPLSLDDLLAQPAASASRQRSGYGSRARAAELHPEFVARIARASTDLDTFTSVIDDPTGISEPFTEALMRTESSAWRSEPMLGSQLLAAVSDGIAQETHHVRVLSEGTVTFSGDTGKVPVTIANDLDRAVTVGITLRGNPTLRLSTEPRTGIRIEPGRMASVDIDARVVGGDPLPVQVQLLTPEGADYGRPATITLASTAYARAASWVVIVAFIAIVVFVLVGVTRRIRSARAQREPGDLEA